MSGRIPRIAVIADTSLQCHLLATAVRELGYAVLFNTDPGQLEPDWLQQQPDLWLVDLSQHDRWQDMLEALLDGARVPILFSDSQAPARIATEYPRWERRLRAKLQTYLGLPAAAPVVSPPAPERVLATPAEFLRAPASSGLERVWVLGASLGGPAAVKLFLDCLPPELPVAFVLAQHIDASFIDTLSRVLCRDNRFDCRVASDGMMLRHGQVVLCPVDRSLTFTRTGRLCVRPQDWEGPYRPSISQVLDQAALNFGARLGTILFSGMGDDGAAGLEQVARRGGTIWAQTADTCVISSQPDAARGTGLVSYSGAPEQLARQLVEHVRRELRAASPTA